MTKRGAANTLMLKTRQIHPMIARRFAPFER